MTTDAALANITLAIKALEPKFVQSGNLGLHLRGEDAAEFKRLAIEAKVLLDHELGLLNDFSMLAPV